MSNTQVERYEQLLAQDPSSTIFVELAKALLDSKDADRAIKVCEQGISYHTRSVVGRVLWGKALIMLGRPAEAMEQFDKAVVVDRENPHAYNLIAEVLLQKGLYRSALPLLRKAAALQPNDARVQQWLTQTQAALQGGPPISLDGPTLLSAATEEPPAKKTDDGPPKENAASDAKPHEGAPPPGGDARPGSAEETTVLSAAQVKSAIEAQQAPKAAPPLTDELPPMLTKGPGLLGDLPAPPDTGAYAREPSHSVPSGEGLLSDVPSFVERPAAALNLPRVEVSPQAREAIAKEYERELREKLAEKAAEKTFLQRHAVKLAAGVILGVAVLVAAYIFLSTRMKNNGHDLADLLASSKKAFLLDTAQGYRAGVDALTQALAMDSSSEDAWARLAYGRALLYAEHGRAEKDKAEAQKALGRPDVAKAAPGFWLAARYYVADGAEREGLKAEVVESTLDAPEVTELEGRILMEKRDTKGALERLSKAAGQGSVRALVALGNYYKDSGDYPRALEFYETAAKISPLHTELVVGEGECRLALWQDFGAALEELEKIPKSEEVSEGLARRRDVAHARLLGATGHATEAVQALNALGRPPPLAQGEVYREVGQMQPAQRAYEAALKSDPKSELAREGLGRVLLAQDREREVLSRVTAEDNAKKVLVVRAAAYAKLGDWSRVRSELQKTQVKGKFPVDSVVYLALADAAEEKADVALKALNDLHAGLKRSRPELSLALGTLYWHEGKLSLAQAKFEEAMKDPLDYEGACSLGRLLLGTGAQDKAQEALQTAVARNGSHAEARHALVRLLLGQGRTEDGFKEAEAWQRDNPASGAAFADYAFAFMQKGDWTNADSASARAVKLEGQYAEGHRVRSQLLFQKGDGRGAFDELERANKLNSKDPETFCDIGRAFLRQGNAQNAPKAFEAALRESPNVSCGKVGTLAAKLPSFSKASLKELEEVAAHAGLVWDRAWAAAVAARGALALGNVKAAKADAELAFKLGPNLAESSFAMGLVAQRGKDEPKARQFLEKAVALNPTDPAYHLAFADLLVRSDSDVPRAVSEYELFLRLSPKSPDQARVKKLLLTLKKRIARR
jgi:tetratricopeptide (TPR) repeat protein